MSALIVTTIVIMAAVAGDTFITGRRGYSTDWRLFLRFIAGAAVVWGAVTLGWAATVPADEVGAAQTVTVRQLTVTGRYASPAIITESGEVYSVSTPLPRVGEAVEVYCLADSHCYGRGVMVVNPHYSGWGLPLLAAFIPLWLSSWLVGCAVRRRRQR